MIKPIHSKGPVKRDYYFFDGNHPDEASDPGDIGVVEAQQREDGVGL